MPSKIVRQINYERNKRAIVAFCEEFNIDSVEYNDGYQIRLEEVLDLYPVRGRWHNIKTGERGDWSGYKDLRRVMVEALDVLTPPVTKKGLVGEVKFTKVDKIQMQNKRGEWVPAIPEPFYGLRHVCACGRKFWKKENYRAHYAYTHIVMGEKDVD